MKAVNLLPSDQRSSGKASPSAPRAAAASGDGFAAYLVLGALAMAVLAFAALTLTKNQISDRTSQLAKAQSESTSVANEAAALKPYADFKQLADARVQTVQALATTRFDWEQTLRDLSHALPRDVRLSGFKGAVRGATQGAVASPTIDLSGCTRNQTSVAKLMAHLRAVRGVSRVALVSSAKAAATGGGGVAGLCGKGNTPTFAISIYFERFGVPAVTGATGAQAAPGAATGATGATGAAAAAPGTAATPAPGSTAPTAPGTTPAAPATTAPNTQGVSAP
jgi:Tfp pilus assembly protein PilN